MPKGAISDAAKPGDSDVDRRLGVLKAGDVELHGQQVVVFADSRCDLLRVAAGGDDGMAGGQGNLCNVHTQAAARAGN